MKDNPSPAKPNQLKPKFIVIGINNDLKAFAFGTPSNRAFHGETAANNAKGVLERLYHNLQFVVLEVRSYVADSNEM